MPTESCGTCRFSAPSRNTDPAALECHRRPPAAVNRREPGVWPNVYSDTWCGEFESRPAAVTKAPARRKPAVGEVEVRGEQG